MIGGTRGIGRAFVKLIAGTERAVSVVGRSSGAPASLTGTGVRYYSMDVLDEDRVKLTLAEVVGGTGKLSHLVFFQRYRGTGDGWVEEWQTGLSATKNVIERLAGEFDGTGANSIVVVGSVASRYIVSEQSVGYHVAKAGLTQLVRYYAVALGPAGIRVNSVSPGTVLKEESKHFYLQNQPLIDLYTRITPLRRMGTAEEVAEVIAFLCSSQASFVTGQDLVIDGGLSLQGHEALSRQVAALDHVKVVRQGH